MALDNNITRICVLTVVRLAGYVSRCLQAIRAVAMRGIFTLVMLFNAAPVLAESVCDEMWFTRNLIFDRAGYCFGSNLGQALFDNSDCTTKSPTLTAVDIDKVARIRANEASLQCQINTSRSRLDLEGVVDLRRLRDLPVRDVLGSGCIGWRGAPVTLRAGHGVRNPEIGQIVRGDSIGFLHDAEGGWNFVTVFWGPGDGQFGWTAERILTEENCAQISG